MKPLTLMLKELIEMIEILQFRCYFKFGFKFQISSLHKLVCLKARVIARLFKFSVIARTSHIIAGIYSCNLFFICDNYSYCTLNPIQTGVFC